MSSLLANEITADYVLGLYRWGLSQRQERGLRLFIKEIRLLFDMAHRVSIPKEYRVITKEVRSPLLRDVALRLTAALTKDPPIMQVKPRDETNDADHAASIAGRWLRAQIEEMNRLSHEDAVYLSALALVRDSESVIKIVHRPEAWANFPARDPGEDAKKYEARANRYRKGDVFCPFAWRAVDRLQMLFGDGEYGDEWALEYGEYSTPYLDRRYSATPSEQPTPEETIAGAPYAEGEGGGGSTGRTVKLEFFDKQSWAVVINGKLAPGFPKDNPYAPFLPYSRATAFPTLYPIKYLVPALDALLTMKMNWAYLSAFPVPIIHDISASMQNMLDSLPTGDSGEPDTQTIWHPGKAWFPPSGKTMEFLQPPPTGRDLDQLVDIIREMIDIAGIPSVMRGAGGSRQAGYAINQLMAASQVTSRKIVESLERQQEYLAQFMFHAIKHTIGQPVYVLYAEGDTKKWLGLKPTGEVGKEIAPIDMLGPPDSTFRPVLPTDEQAMAMISLQTINAPHPLFSHKTVLSRFMQVEDPGGEIDDIVTDQALESEPLKSRMIQEAMREAGVPIPSDGGGGGPPGGGGGGGAVFVPNDMTNRGEPTVPALTQPIQPARPRTETIGPGQGGRPAGTFPGQPAGGRQP